MCNYCESIKSSTPASPKKKFVYCPMCGIKLTEKVVELSKEWTPISEKLPPLGACIICTVKDHFRNQRELRYPVYYLEKTFEKGYAFYFGGDILLPDISEVIAWKPMVNIYEGEE